MSSLALMRWLEASPQRYDAGMRALSFGRVPLLHAAVVATAVREPGDYVLEVGCGTGTVTTALVERGARVLAIDQSAEMLELAAQRVKGEVEWREQTASEVDRLPEASFDSVVLSLCLSDMSASERAFVLKHAAARLRPRGLLVVADEMQAPRGWRRAIQLLWRGPQAALAWLLVGSVSRPVPDLASELHAAGFELRSEERWLFGTLGLIVATPAEVREE